MTDLFQEIPDPNKNYIQELVGEGKKFKSVEDLARGKYEADNMIEIFKRQQDQLRSDYLKLQEDYNSRAKLEELIDQRFNTPERIADSREPIAEVRDKPFDPKLIEDTVSKKLSEYEAGKVRTQNAQTVVEKLKERYGNSYQSFLNDKTEELGMSKEQINAIAETNPKLLITALGLNEFPRTDPFQAPPRSTSTAFVPTGQKKRTWAYYQELKKTDPKSYYDPKTNVQMERDYVALGSEFEDGDFRKYGDSAFA